MKIGKRSYATIEQIQDVWLALSEDGSLSIRRLAKVVGMRATKTATIVTFLEQCGYIEHEQQKTGRRVIIPLVSAQIVHNVGAALRSKLLTESKAEQPR